MLTWVVKFQENGGITLSLPGKRGGGRQRRREKN